MKMQLVAVKDLAVSAFMQPQFVHHVGVAVRSFADSVNDEKDAFNKHATDFELYHLAEFDDQTGQFYPLDSGQPDRLARAADLKTSS